MTLDTNSVAAVAVTAKPMQQSQATNGKPKEKRRSNEKRKEKSRDAARCRRSRETEIFTELAQVLPLPKEEVDQLDKASVMRLAIGQLKIRDMLQLFPKIKDVLEEPTNDTKTNKETNTSEEDTTQSDDEKEEKLFDLWKTAETHKILMQTLDGFLIILSNDGDVTYVSENITEYLGISKIDILGQQIWEYSHQCDHDELKEAMNIKKNVMNDKVKDENLIEEGIITDHRDLFIRLKCTLTSRGRSVNIKSATYKVIHITGHLVVNAKGDRVLIAIGRPIPHPSNIEIPLGSTTFLTKHSLDMKFTYVDDKMSSLFGYKPDDLLDKSLYDCHHGGDSDSLMATFKSVLSKGQGETCRYRFLGKCGGYCWIVTQATIVYDKQKPQSVVCVNYVLSNLENNNEIYSLAQYEASQVEQTESNVNNTTTADQPQKLQQQQQPESQQKPIELSENTPKLIQQQQATPQKQQQQKQSNKQIEEKQNELVINLDSGLVPELPKKTCADVDEKKSTSAGELQLKREQPSSAISQTNSTNINVIANTKPAATSTIPTVTATPPIAVLQQPIEQVNNSKYVPPVTSFRNRPYRPILLGRLPLNNNSTSSTKYGDENRPKSVTASVFRSASDIEKPIISASGLGLNHTIVVNQANLPQLMVAPTAQSVTASVFTPISQLRTPQIIQSANRAKILIQPKQYQQQQQQQARAQRAAAMNKGYLTFPMDTSTLTMLKEEPDDLAHLAPSGVDALDDSTPLFNDMLAGLMSYSNLLPDDINSLDSQHGGNQTTPGSVNNKGHIDPFINYREESNDTNCSQHLLSPSINSKSPEASSLPSLCSPNSLSQDDDFPFMTMNVDDEIDLSMRAPFIPMNEQDDLPLLTDDLMWGVGFTAEDLNNYKEDGMQYSSLKQQMNISTNNQMLNSAGNNNNNCTSNTNLANLSPAASPMSISSSSAASSPSPCSSNSPLSMHNQHCGSYGGSLLCNTGSGDIIGSGGGGGGDGGGSSARSVDDSDSGISSINSMSPQHTHPSHKPLNHQSHHSQQQQQHHSPMSVVNDSLSLITCKKEIDAGSLCDSIDAFDSGYSKDSPNLECWVPELLNINSNDSRVTVDELQQTHKQQNIIINTATMPTTTLHVPLITIQNNKNISMNQQQQRTTTSSSSLISGKLATNTPSSSASSSPSSTSSSSPSALLSSATTSYCHNNNSNNSNSNKQCTDGGGGGSLMLTEEMLQNNRKLTGKMPTSNTPTTLRILNGNLTNGRNQTSPKTAILHTANLAALQGNNHKRHLVTGGASVLDPKRLKNSSTVEIQTTPRLLQQLMAPGPQKHTIVEKTPNGGVYEKAQLQPTQRWANENNGGGLQQQMLRNQQQQDSNLNHNINQTLASSSSNSVLKNLLVSGCDNIIIKSGPEIMITEDMSNDSIAQLSPCDSFASINCDTSDSNILRNCRSNPMIGGPVLLPSPPFPPDDNPPELLSMSENEASCDSGIDDSCAMKPTIIKNLIPDAPEKLYPKVDIIKEALKSGDVLISNVDQCTTNTVSIPTHGTPPTADRQEEQQQQQQANNMSRNSNRKSSLSFMDNGNPVLTSILMDLCNDDYNMNESDYLEDTDLVQVLNNLTDDIILSGGDKA